MFDLKNISGVVAVVAAIIGLVIGLLIPSPIAGPDGSSSEKPSASPTTPPAEAPVIVFGELPTEGITPLAEAQVKDVVASEWWLPIKGANALLSFNGDQTVSIQTGCNDLLAPYSIKDSVLTLGEMIGTVMACPKADAANENALASFFSKPLKIFVNDDVSDMWLSDGTTSLELGRSETALAKEDR